MLGLGLSLSLGAQYRVGYSAAAMALFERMEVQPDSTRKRRINELLASGVTNGWLAKQSLLYVHAAHTEQAASINWVSDTFTLTKNGTPDFTVDRGFLGGASGQYLSTGYVPSAEGDSRDDMHIGAWSLTDANENTPMISPSAPSAGAALTIYPRTSGNMAARVNEASGSATIGAVANSLGHFVAARGSATARRGYKDGALVASVVVGDGSVCDDGIELLGNGTSQWSTRRQAVSHVGLNMTDEEVLSMYQDLTVYLTAIGAVA